MEGSEWEDVIFNAKSLGTSSWRMSALCLRAAISVFDDMGSISSMSPELLDFVMCGLVTAFDSCDDALNSQIDIVGQLEALAGLALKMFGRCAEVALDGFSNSLDVDWPNFFLPMMSRIIVRWFTLLKVDDRATFFVRTLVHALLQVRELPDDLSLSKKLCPELDKLGYEAVHQTLIIHSEDLIMSENPFIRFAALHLLKLMSSLMYRHQNGQWMDEEKVSSSGPRRVVVADTLARIISDTTGWPAIVAFDAALVPLKYLYMGDGRRGNPSLEDGLPNFPNYFIK
ncbi:hypothetical protein ANCCAN_20444 [Ancylostoma caninum]|uniref:E3 ubiquitin-protein ligase listerin HEAT-repeats region domain-containing protein n=1 Tax=Ancylostoma caninum TaxID=29170 RepID=A0A368FNG1_ANCCA|nr:hypothetical protein ANCCAN_20444 [Ancylostoma caninum]